MVIDISPILGLSLLELVEGATIAIPFAIAVSAAVTGFFSLRSIRQSKAQARQSQIQITKQLEMQNKIASAQLAWKLLEYWREEKHEWFRVLLVKIRESEIKSDDLQIGTVLNIFEDIAIWWQEGTLTDNHVKEFFGNNLRDIRENQVMQDRIKKGINLNSELFFVSLHHLLEKTREWGF